MKCYINVVYYLCNLTLIYTGGEPAQQSKIKLSIFSIWERLCLQGHLINPGTVARRCQSGLGWLWREINAGNAAEFFKGSMH